jgi:uncharacterized protein YbjQ (UPF0145 family)
MSAPKVFVTTTPMVEGWEIESYLGPIFSHIVAGTGFFSDFAASFSDIFGGRSQTYQKQLSAINAEAIELFKNKASLLGGNLILGLRIDHDEISGKAKQMFMVTAYGTAVRGIQKASTKDSRQNSSYMTADAVEVALKRKEIIEAGNTIPIRLTEAGWNLAIENQIHEIAPQVLSSLEYSWKHEQFVDQVYCDTRRKYFLTLPAVYSVPALYEALKTTEKLFDFIRDTIHQGDLFDFDGIISLLNSDEFIVRKWALILSQFNKSYYLPDDVERFKQLIEKIQSSFSVRAQFIEEKSKLSSSVKAKWLCECGQKNDKDKQWCVNCSRDIYGFTPTEPDPEKVVALIQSKLDVLQQSFGKGEDNRT